MEPQQSLRKRLAKKEIIVAPGIYDAFGPMMAARVGFEALYLSGASLTYSRLGRPDLGLIDLSEIARAVGQLRDRVDLPIIVDGEAGFGNALNVQRAVRVLEREGANAIQIEDQALPKRCGHLAGKTLVSVVEMAGKVRAAVDARRSENTLVIARTDAVAVEGYGPALDRGESYLEAGADILFVEALTGTDQMRQVADHFAGRVPLLANMVEGGKTPILPAGELERLGFSLAIFPGGLMRAVAQTMDAYFTGLKTAGDTTPFKDRMLDFAELNELLETAKILEDAKRYDDQQ